MTTDSGTRCDDTTLRKKREAKAMNKYNNQRNTAYMYSGSRGAGMPPHPAMMNPQRFDKSGSNLLGYASLF